MTVEPAGNGGGVVAVDRGRTALIALRKCFVKRPSPMAMTVLHTIAIGACSRLAIQFEINL